MTQVTELLHRSDIDAHRLGAAAEALTGGAGVVERQGKVGRSVEMPFPIFEPSGELWSLHPFALPGRVVRVLDGVGTQRRGAAAGKSVVQRDQLGQDGPREAAAVKDEVVQGQVQAMIVIRSEE